MKVATNFVVRLIVLILVFLLGFLSCAGAIVGVAYYAYKNVSVDTFGINTDEYIDRENADVILPSMTLEGLVNEYFEVSSLGDEVSIDFLVDRYGLLLPENVDGAIPDRIKVMPLTTVFSEEGVHEVLKCFYIGQFLGLESEEIADAGEGEDKFQWYDPETGEKANALNNMLANYTFYDFMIEGIDTQGIIDRLTIADVMEMECHENVPVYLNGSLIPTEELTVDVWYGRGGYPSEKIMSAIAPSKINDVEAALKSYSIMQIMGYVDYNGETYETRHFTGADEHIELVKAEGLAAELAHVSLDSISNGGLEEEVQDIPLYIALGYEKAEDGSFTNNGVPVEGLMSTVCDYKVGELDQRIKEVTIGEIAGYEKVLVSAEGEKPVYKYYSTYDKDNPANCIEASGIVGALADLTVNDLDDEKALSTRVETIKVSTLLDYKYDEDGKYYYTEDELGNKNEVTGIMAVIADSSLNSVEEDINGSYMGDILGFTYKDRADVILTDENGIIQYNEDGTPKTGTVKWWYDGDTPVHTMMNAISNYKFSDMGDISGSLTIGNVIAPEERMSGFISLVPPDTKLNEMSNEMESTFGDKTINEFIDCGAIEVQGDNAELFKQTYGGYTLQGLMNKLLADLSAVPNP